MKIKKRISIILMTFQMLLGVIAFGQENNNKNKNLKNTVFVEALGNGLFGSINYERQLTKEPGLSLRAGIGFYTEYDFYLTLPFSIQYLIDLNRNNFIETGIGYTWVDAGADDIFNNESVKNSDNLNNLFLSVGYKKHFGKDWMWKANFTPLITNNKEVTLPWIGVSIGKRF
tara:strand:- start:957 stop:1472 length:516 start_codon:yes stop_codon:yes gene_type:complete